MKVVIVGPYPLNINKISGGVEAVTVYLIEGLKQIRNLDIRVITCRREISNEKSIEKGGITIHYLPSSRHFGNITFGFMNNYRIRKKIKEINPDIVHFQNITNFSYLFKEPKYKCVTTIHGIIHVEDRFTSGVTNRIRRMFRNFLETEGLRKNKNIISISSYARGITEKVTSASLVNIPNAVSDKFFAIRNQEMIKQVLCVAPISNLKNQSMLLKAIKIVKQKIPDIKLNFAGEVRDHQYFEKMQIFIEVNGLNYVKFMGHLTERELLKEYSQSSIVLLTSLQENSPMAIQQAMAAGKSVIATRVGGNAELVEDGKTGFLIDCCDISSLAEKIELLLSNKKLRRKFGENAKLEALKRFKTEIIAQKTYKVYKEILGVE